MVRIKLSLKTFSRILGFSTRSFDKSQGQKRTSSCSARPPPCVHGWIPAVMWCPSDAKGGTPGTRHSVLSVLQVVWPNVQKRGLTQWYPLAELFTLFGSQRIDVHCWKLNSSFVADHACIHAGIDDILAPQPAVRETKREAACSAALYGTAWNPWDHSCSIPVWSLQWRPRQGREGREGEISTFKKQSYQDHPVTCACYLRVACVSDCRLFGVRCARWDELFVIKCNQWSWHWMLWGAASMEGIQSAMSHDNQSCFETIPAHFATQIEVQDYLELFAGAEIPTRLSCGKDVRSQVCCQSVFIKELLIQNLTQVTKPISFLFYLWIQTFWSAANVCSNLCNLGSSLPAGPAFMSWAATWPRFGRESMVPTARPEVQANI